MPLADGDGRKHVQKFVEDLRGGLRGALRKSLAHEISAGRGQRARGSGFGHSSNRTDGERSAKDAEIVVVHLIAESGVADLIQPLKMIEAHGIAVWHEQAMEGNRQAALPKALDFPGFPEKLRACRNQKMLAVVGIDIIGEQDTRWDRTSARRGG